MVVQDNNPSTGRMDWPQVQDRPGQHSKAPSENKEMGMKADFQFWLKQFCGKLEVVKKKGR